MKVTKSQGLIILFVVAALFTVVMSTTRSGTAAPDNNETSDEFPRPLSVSQAKPDKPKDIKTIPLTSIYSTSFQKGLMFVSWTSKEKHGHALEQLRQTVHGGVSSVFLVRAASLSQAIEASAIAYASGLGVDIPIQTDRLGKEKEMWLVSYLGINGSEPPEWLIVGLEIHERTVRLRYKRSDSMTGDRHRYFVWSSLGQLDSGTYSLELFDESVRKAVVTRLVTIPE